MRLPVQREPKSSAIFSYHGGCGLLGVTCFGFMLEMDLSLVSIRFILDIIYTIYTVIDCMYISVCLGSLVTLYQYIFNCHFFHTFTDSLYQS